MSLPDLPELSVAKELLERLAEQNFSLEHYANFAQESKAEDLLARLPLQASIPTDGLPALYRLWTLGWSTSLRETREVFGERFCERMITAGLLHIQNDTCQARHTLIHFRKCWVFSDRFDQVTHQLPFYVMAPSYSTVQLLPFIETQKNQVHELGCGSGLLGLLLCQKGAQVSFSDLNPRAVAYCKLNLALNHLNGEAWVSDWASVLHNTSPSSYYIFNTPSLPDVAHKGILANHVNSAPNAFIQDLLRSMLHTGQAFAFWACLTLTHHAPSPLHWLESIGFGQVEGLLFTMDIQSPFNLTPKHILRKKRPMMCWLCNSEDEPALFKFCSDQNLHSVVSGTFSFSPLCSG